ncbi:hypothetical protein CPB84DRAFT_829058 [Gymnopilus junonius]|uniref:SET domain-containing protein n=1 Tax=Gymnopilus junonius TaxID=109634 RepID=A0A9P5N9T5_GYMJU|nr:hypothetical protein CPB84DRAFT_829058 [Gymnopilus junonius]
MTRSKSKAKAKKRASLPGNSAPSSSSSKQKQKTPSASPPDPSAADAASLPELGTTAEMLKEYLVDRIMALKDDKKFCESLKQQKSTEELKELFYGVAALAMLSADSEISVPSAFSAQATAGPSKRSKLPKTPFTIPEGYKSKITMAAGHRLEIDYPAGTMLFTTIPSRNITDPLDPDGHSEFWCDAATKGKIVNAPGYLKPIPKPRSSGSSSPAYIVKATPTKGLGVFATKDIQMGELIFAERPLLVVPRGNHKVVQMLNLDLDLDLALDLDDEKHKEMVMLEWEKQLEVAVGRMLKKDREAFMELANSHTGEQGDGSGPILGIVRTNGFSMSGKVFDGEKLWDDGANGYSGIVKIGSRINHSCIPNIDVDFSLSSFSFQFIARADIKAGQELFYSYTNIEQPTAERQSSLLLSYGFTCDCPACVYATPRIQQPARGVRPSRYGVGGHASSPRVDFKQ